MPPELKWGIFLFEAQVDEILVPEAGSYPRQAILILVNVSKQMGGGAYKAGILMSIF